MSGHNKWSKIKHKKAITDGVKAKVYTKYNKLIQVAIKEAGGSVDSPAVSMVIDKARKENVPKDNIDRAIKKATSSDAASLIEAMYEAYGPAGVGIIVKVITDNTNRAVTEIKTILTKNGGTFANSGAVSWAFTKNSDGDWGANAGTEVEVGDMDGEKLANIVNLLEESDEVTDVYTNAL